MVSLKPHKSDSKKKTLTDRHNKTTILVGIDCGRDVCANVCRAEKLDDWKDNADTADKDNFLEKQAEFDELVQLILQSANYKGSLQTWL